MAGIRVRPARASEAAVLTALCIRSKARWGYDAAFMRQAASALAIAPSMIAEGAVLVAEDRLSRPIGVAAIEKIEGARFDLARLFVDPAAMRTGVGRALFAAAVRLAAERGGASLAILSDPCAEPFYRRLGAVRVGEAPSDAIPGRTLPLLEYAIADSSGTPPAS